MIDTARGAVMREYRVETEEVVRGVYYVQAESEAQACGGFDEGYVPETAEALDRSPFVVKVVKVEEWSTCEPSVATGVFKE